MSTSLLRKWYCDVCGETIADAREGYVVWQWNAEHKYHGFKIIHQTTCDLKDHPASAALTDFLGVDGLSILLSKVSLGPVAGSRGNSYCGIANFDEYVDLIRRVQLPYYEDARRRFQDPEVLESMSDWNEVSPYLQESLKRLAPG